MNHQLSLIERHINIKASTYPQPKRVIPFLWLRWLNQLVDNIEDQKKIKTACPHFAKWNDGLGASKSSISLSDAVKGIKNHMETMQ